jgi:hypothetical protein
MSRKVALTVVDSAYQWQEHVKPILTQYSSKDILNLDESALYCNGHLKRTLALKGEKCQ